MQKLFETARATAFKVHTYQHTTMGFLKDVEAMPDEYDYSLQFFDRYYRPEYTTIIVAGDVDPKRVRSLIDERWGTWKRGNLQAFNSRRTAAGWPAHRPCRLAFRDSAADRRSLTAAPLIPITPKKPRRSTPSPAWVSIETSPLYQKLVIEEQKLDSLNAGPPNNIDPELFGVLARVKKAADLPSIQQQIIATAEGFAAKPVDAKKLDALKEHLRYEFALQLNNSEAIAGTVAQFVALRRTPETINRYYDEYAKLTPADIQNAAREVSDR